MLLLERTSCGRWLRLVSASGPLTRDAAVGRVVDRVKELESQGWTFEAADASFELLLREEVEGSRPSFFTIESWRTIVEQLPSGEVLSQATVKIRVGHSCIASFCSSQRSSEDISRDC